MAAPIIMFSKQNKEICFTEDLVSSRVIVDNNTSQFVLNETAEVQVFLKPVGEIYDNDTVGFVLYQNDNLFPSKHEKKLGFRKKIISASISRARANVEFSFNHQFDPSYTLVQYACVFWDYEWNEWNTTGCQKKISNQMSPNETSSNSIISLQCTCHHTTNFAVLMKFKENINFASLNIVSVIGCALSVTGLSITVIFLFYARKKKSISWILISFCSSLLIFYILFIVAMETSEYTVVSANPNQDSSENSFFWSDLEKVCWLLAENKEKQFDISKPMLWSFLLPVGLILIANICIVIGVVLTIWKNKPELTRTKRISFLKKILATFSVVSLLGITWVAGYLMLIETDDNTYLIFSFIFCLCCSTQGVQIFIFYTLRSPIFVKLVLIVIRKFKLCKIYMHSQKYWVTTKIRERTTRRYHERFRNLSDSHADLCSDDTESKE
ncbi:adhesion G-protein coupled receptor G7 [Bufo gargarizans]|uniref:adhesion G-protein coupled receptor G7 n=1 Tax=Bufo gargarizans TaxID=30331 RepID=UPI001CF5ED1A|nr:adhesion G-protein coupled receptor G7 [Bufo gargarizans]